MKTRIISATVALALFVAILLLHNVLPIALDIMFLLICILAVYEALNNTGIVKSFPIILIALVFAVFSFLAFRGILAVSVSIITVLYSLVVIIYAVVNHNSFDVKQMTFSILFPLILSYAFSTLASLADIGGTGLLYFILSLIFAWGADTGAYFAGTFFGKHKLCPEISPKKTVEGAVGGILSSVLLSVLLCIIYSDAVKINYFAIVIAAIIFAVVGMFGDLFASYIKREVGIKDYGNIMPGHGGVLDRFDSVLLIAPCFYLFLTVFKLI